MLAQPCDLMVRNDGKRHPEITHVPMAEVVVSTEPPRQATEMSYFGDNANERGGFWLTATGPLEESSEIVTPVGITTKDW